VVFSQGETLREQSMAGRNPPLIAQLSRVRVRVASRRERLDSEF